MKEIENQTVRDQELMQMTFELAISNVMRKKGKKYKKLFKKLAKAAVIEPPITKKEAKKLKAAIREKFLQQQNR